MDRSQIAAYKTQLPQMRQTAPNWLNKHFKVHKHQLLTYPTPVQIDQFNQLPTPNNTVINPTTHSIANTGATETFLQSVNDATNIGKADTLITARYPNGTTSQTTHIGQLNLPQLPMSARTTHILPDLTHWGLISISKICNAGCQVLFAQMHVIFSTKKPAYSKEPT